MARTLTKTKDPKHPLPHSDAKSLLTCRHAPCGTTQGALGRGAFQPRSAPAYWGTVGAPVPFKGTLRGHEKGRSHPRRRIPCRLLTVLGRGDIMIRYLRRCCGRQSTTWGENNLSGSRLCARCYVGACDHEKLEEET